MSIIFHKMTFKKRFFKTIENVNNIFIDFDFINFNASNTLITGNCYKISMDDKIIKQLIEDYNKFVKLYYIEILDDDLREF